MVALLGHIISQKGIEADPSKINALMEVPFPRTGRDMISFLQKVCYLSHFIHLLSNLIAPIQTLAHEKGMSGVQNLGIGL